MRTMFEDVSDRPSRTDATHARGPRLGRVFCLLAACALVLAVAGCGGEETPDAGASPRAAAPTATPAPQQLVIDQQRFLGSLEVKTGATIEVVNRDSVAHTVTADDGKSFDLQVPASSTQTLTAPAAANTYAFHCNIHPTMKGSLKVT